MAQRKNISSNVIPFPGRREPVVQAAARGAPWPDNVRPIRPPAPEAPTEPLPATGYVLIAIIEAMQAAARKGKGAMPDVVAELVEMYWRWEEDPEVRKGVARALNLVMAAKTGRW